MREQYIRTGEGFLLVYSIDKDYFPIIVVANKCDLEMKRQVSGHEELAKQFNCRFIEISTKQHVNVDETFYNLVREIRRYDKEQSTSSTI
ncbi:P-loop containing nucleoside triphosphate hydrolase protein [Rhizophagus diaphanus]|nr:P-loop containing nucleoside triphosphate hydrolase protein [Rhizophagus diaphanus] [Rhizophagus sp. MUCL 43196]